MKTKVKKPYLLLVAAIVLWCAFIFSNSCVSREASGEVSGSISGPLTPLLEALFGADAATADVIVRKCGHLLEFSLLGFLVCRLVRKIKTNVGRSYDAHGALFALLVGVFDEYIQSFTGRGSQVQDVLIDFVGAMLGFGICFGVSSLAQNYKKKRINS